MRVNIDIYETTLQGDYGDVPGLEGTCEQCGHTIEVYGDGEPSERALCAKMREECPEHETNYYVAKR